MGKILVRPVTATATATPVSGERRFSSGRSVMANLETAGINRRVQNVLGFLSNVTVQLALTDCFDEGADFVVFAGYLHFDAAISQVPHPSCDIKSLGDMANGPTESNALDAALEVNLERKHDRLSLPNRARRERRSL